MTFQENVYYTSCLQIVSDLNAFPIVDKDRPTDANLMQKTESK